MHFSHTGHYSFISKHYRLICIENHAGIVFRDLKNIIRHELLENDVEHAQSDSHKFSILQFFFSIFKLHIIHIIHTIPRNQGKNEINSTINFG